MYRVHFAIVYQGQRDRQTLQIESLWTISGQAVPQGVSPLLHRDLVNRIG
jgi:hypothetical protein